MLILKKGVNNLTEDRGEKIIAEIDGMMENLRTAEICARKENHYEFFARGEFYD